MLKSIVIDIFPPITGKSTLFKFLDYFRIDLLLLLIRKKFFTFLFLKDSFGEEKGSFALMVSIGPSRVRAD